MRWIFARQLTGCDGQASNNNDLRTDFVYDGRGRLRIRVEYDGVKTTGEWLTNTVVHYIYDGMRVIQERNSSNTPTVSYTRGTDLSGSLEGAGGIGGLLGRSHAYQTGSGNFTNHNFYHADGNGNITYMLNSSQSVVANYRYDPFGNTISKSGSLANANLYRFSSKEIHVNSGLYYYGYRFYHPNLQRWLNRDPIGEEGGINLYGFVSGNPLISYDAFGLQRGSPGPSAPAPDTCTPDQRKQIEKAMAAACKRVSGPCPPGDPSCQSLMDQAREVCTRKRPPKIKCARPGDKTCAEGDCAYEDNGTITLCGIAWPADGSNCPGDTGNINLECLLVHEMLHVGQGRKDDPDDANKLQKCVGCPAGDKHRKR